MPMMPIATAHEITSPRICMAFLNLKTAKALGHNHCAPIWWIEQCQFLPHCRMSAFGPKRTSLVAPHMSAFGGKADMPFCTAYVCF